VPDEATQLGSQTHGIASKSQRVSKVRA